MLDVRSKINLKVTRVRIILWVGIRLFTGDKVPAPQLTLAYGHLQPNHSRSRSNLAASSCVCYRSVSHSRSRFWAPRHLSSHAICDEKNVKFDTPCWGSQFQDPLHRAAGGDSPPAADAIGRGRLGIAVWMG
jgi:hypothetical protein